MVGCADPCTAEMCVRVNNISATKRHWCHFAALGVLYMSVWIVGSIVAPFFPPEAIKKGASQTTAGLVLGAFSITSFLVGSPLGNVIPRFGAKFSFLFGVGFCGATNLLFGLLDRIENSTAFVTLSLLMRVAEAVGSTAASIAAMTLVGGHYPDTAPLMLGLLETISGFAFMVGPMIGSWLYAIGGYELPFCAMSGFLFIFLIVNLLVLPDKYNLRSNHGTSWLRFLRVSAVWPAVLALLVNATSLGLFNVGVAYHAIQRGIVSPDNAGIIFFAEGGSYALCSTIFGWLLNRTLNRFWIIPRVTSFVGVILTAVSYIMLGPSPWLPFIPSTLSVLMASCIGVGLSMSMVCVPAVLDMVITAEWYGYAEAAAAYSLASGIFVSFFHLGSFLGLTAGGALIDKCGFEATANGFAVLNLVAAVAIALASAWEFWCGKGRNSGRREIRPRLTDEGAIPLINGQGDDPLTSSVDDDEI